MWKKGAGFLEKNTTSTDHIPSCQSVEIIFDKFTNEAKAKVLTLSFVEQANTFAIGSRKNRKKNFL